MKKIIYFILLLLIIAGAVFGYYRVTRYLNENKILKLVISRLEADSRIAEVLVTDVHYDLRRNSGKNSGNMLLIPRKQRRWE